MEKYIDKKALVTTLLAIAIAFLLKKWFVKEYTIAATGLKKIEVGHEAIGHV